MPRARKSRIVVKTPAVKKIDKQQDKEIRALKKDVRILKGANEAKHHDESLTFAGFSHTASQQANILDPAQGDGDTQRIGDEVTASRLESRWVLIGDNDAVTTFRIMIMWDKQNALADFTDFLTVTGNSQAVNSPVDWDKKKLFSILYDKTFTFNVGTLVDGSVTAVPFEMERHIKINLNLKNKKVVFQGGGTTVNVNALKIFLWSNNATVGAQANGITRVIFHG